MTLIAGHATPRSRLPAAQSLLHNIDDVKAIQAVGRSLAFVEEDIDPDRDISARSVLTVLLAVTMLEHDNLVTG